MDQKYSEVLSEVFDVLGFTEPEAKHAMESFKKKLAFEILKSLEAELPQDQKEWLSKNTTAEPNDPKILEIQSSVKGLYSSQALFEKSRPIFKKLLENYIEFMSSDLNPEEVSKLKAISEKV